ncbi:hypothetical protein MBM_09198 [Drepanopeziza brunnea f. sp. 'multigermtubi' MB_m1]|uniref:Uncharacterized protein n=1 Tax=Marssonina brunnea f. sp. multigermtubi (strain MB_m1) TaxID=1072389 RepID=K1XJR7_MARBU|nr:uncharacterized protein MBM_09198 [Drepanopeziza brunnea f. sp. 'multigermtubi' MB_m1]EKD12629.1 hypothetical protein MBM_09198 [Drepanopeziza brunnea f. sp. 'multigermtubi' MB_m1]
MEEHSLQQDEAVDDEECAQDGEYAQDEDEDNHDKFRGSEFRAKYLEVGEGKWKGAKCFKERCSAWIKRKKGDIEVLVWEWQWKSSFAKRERQERKESKDREVKADRKEQDRPRKWGRDKKVTGCAKTRATEVKGWWKWHGVGCLTPEAGNERGSSKRAIRDGEAFVDRSEMQEGMEKGQE